MTIAGMGMQMEGLVLGWYVLNLTNSPFLPRFPRTSACRQVDRRRPFDSGRLPTAVPDRTDRRPATPRHPFLQR